MSDLENRARAIVDAGRDADFPSTADRGRIKRAVLAQIAAGGVAASAATASAATAGALSVGAKVGLAMLVLSLAGGGTVGLLKARDASRAAEEPGRPAAVRGAPAMAAPDPIPEVVSPPPPAAVVVEDKSRRVERSRKTVLAGGRSDKEDEDRLNAEVDVLKRAREELRLGRPARALEALVEYDRRFGKGVLGEERQAMAAIAACQSRPGPSARAQADAFVRGSPLSPLRERVREACITPPAANSP